MGPQLAAASTHVSSSVMVILYMLMQNPTEGSVSKRSIVGHG